MRKCPKSIDKPFLFLGLEIEELCVLIIVFYYVAALSYLFIGLIFVVFSWIFMLKVKKGKPQGSVLHFFYKLGLPLKGLVKNNKKGDKFSLFSKKLNNK